MPYNINGKWVKPKVVTPTKQLVIKKNPKGNLHYKVGYALERDVKKALEADGNTVFRMAGSHSPADLISFRFGYKTVLIQCKRHKNLMTQKEILTFYRFAEGIGCDSAIAYRDKGIHVDQISLKAIKP